MLSSFLQENVTLCITSFWLIAMSVLEVSKIKINPWSAIFSAIGRAVNKELILEVQECKDYVNNLKEELMKEKKERAQDVCFSYRNIIINDANRLRQKEQFTRSKYDTLIEIHKRYNNLVDENQLPNDVLEFDFEYIMDRMKQADKNGELT